MRRSVGSRVKGSFASARRREISLCVACFILCVGLAFRAFSQGISPSPSKHTSAKTLPNSVPNDVSGSSIGAIASKPAAIATTSATSVISSQKIFTTTLAPSLTADKSKTEARVRKAYGRLPLSFEQNQGQQDASVKFISKSAGGTLFLSGDEAILALPKSRSATARANLAATAISRTGSDLKKAPTPSNHAGTAADASTLRKLVQSTPEFKGMLPNPQEVLSESKKTDYSLLRMRLLGANPKPSIMGEEKQPGVVNYLIGKDPSQWHTHVSCFGQVRYTGVYPGIDQVYYGNQQRLEYDFIVAPHADPSQINLSFTGASKLSATSKGDLVITLPDGQKVTQKAPVVYQNFVSAGKVTRHPVTGKYLLASNTVGGPGVAKSVRLEVGEYDHETPLIIDPVLIYSTFFGYDAQAYGIAVDGAGCTYITGATQNGTISTTSQAYQATASANATAFVTKFSADGSTLVYSTYLGGSQGEYGYSIALDSSGCAYITGFTVSTNH